MFTCKMYNPNHMKIDNKCEYDVVPFGHRCTSALACKYANLRHFSLPFDWTSPLFPDKIKSVLENNFDGFIPDVENNQFVNRYNFGLAHFNKDAQKGIEEYARRIDRFRWVMNEPSKKYFVYINEDYLYDPYYRTDVLNDYNFVQMLELEHVIRKLYPQMDYTILYFNFKQHVIPSHSRILNIVLKSDVLYDNEESSAVSTQNFRDFCGNILARVFDTNMQSNTWVYTEDLYNN